MIYDGIQKHVHITYGIKAAYNTVLGSSTYGDVIFQSVSGVFKTLISYLKHNLFQSRLAGIGYHSDVP